jgi:hypothetical protein
MRTVVLFCCVFAATSTAPWRLLAQGPAPATNIRFAQINADEMRGWLTHLASDELGGRQVFTEGYGLAAQYVAGHLQQWGVKPLGANGTYLQPVRVRGYRSTRNSSVTLETDGETRTFRHGDHVTFPANAGGRQTLTFDRVEFLGHGTAADYAGRAVKGSLVVTMPRLAPQPGAAVGRGGAGARAGGPGAIASGAAAAIVLAPAPAAPSAAEQALAQAQKALAEATAAVAQAQQSIRGGRGRQGAAGRGAAAPPDFTSVQRLDAPVAPQFTADDTFFEALFRDAPVRFAEIRARAEKGEAVEPLSFPARVTIAIDNGYEVISEQMTHNVVGMVEGTDARLKDTYVLIGAHLDHVGYSQAAAGRGSATDACRRRSPAAQASVVAAGRVVQRPEAARGAGGRAGGGAGGRGDAAAVPPPFDERDRISNGADDDASGSTALMAIAKAFATGPAPRRSVVFAWHAGEETGLYGSRFNADFPAVPIDRVQAHINMDMIGRDDCDNIEGDYSNTVFVVGADRISTGLHNLIVETNATFRTPLALDFELNDPSDPENIYTRSDHYSYAVKGIPVAFFTTGLHPDYHRASDAADKILFPKMARIAQLVYQTAFSIAHSERALERDNKGARTGFGSKAEVIP